MANEKISVLPAATVASFADLFPVTQDYTTVGTGVTRKMTGTLLFSLLATPPAIGGTTPATGQFTTLGSTGTLTFGSGSTNYGTLSGAATTGAATLGASGADTHVGVGLLPKGSYPTVTTKILVAPTTSWAAGSANFVTRVRPQVQISQTSTTVPTGTGFYPQFSVNGGSIGGYADVGGAGLAYMNNITVDNDNVIANSGSGPQGLALLGVNLGVGNASGAAGSAHKGGRNGIAAEIFINSDIDVGPGSLFHVGIAGGTTAFRKMGGIVGSYRGNVFGANVWARARAGSGGGPRYLNSLVGTEIGIRQDLYTSALWKMGLQIVEENTSASNAEQQNIGLSITNQPSASTIGWTAGMSFSAYNGQFSVAPYGQMITTLPSPIGLSSFLAADGINLTRVTFSRAAMEFPGFYLNGTGMLGGQTVGGLTLQTVSGVFAKVSSVASVSVVEGGSFNGGNAIATTGTYLSADTAVTVASFAGIYNGMLVTGADIQAGTTLVSGAGTVNFVLSLPTTGAGTGAALSFTQPMPPFALASPVASGGVAGVTATMRVTNMGATGFMGVTAGGNGLYIAGETLTAVDGTGTPFTVYVETVVAGVPTNIRIVNVGDYTVLPTNPVTFTGSAAGLGFAVGMRWTILTVSSTAGTNYNELRPPMPSFTGAMVQTREARFKVLMTAGTGTNLILNNAAAYVDTSGGLVVDSVTAGPIAGAAIEASSNFAVAGLQVVGTRKTGWTVATGTASRATFDTATVTLAQLAGRVMAMEQDMISHGLIGT